MNYLIEQYWAGGLFMHFITFFGMLCMAIIIDRTYQLYLKFKNPPTDFRQNVYSLIIAGNYADALDYVEAKSPDSAVGRIIKVGLKLRKHGCGDEEIQARMDEVLQKEIGNLDKRTGFLAVFGNVCTLYGLLGTVTGLISSFAGVSAASPVERANLLTQGIAVALNTTAYGLICAIPALVLYAVFQNKTDNLIATISEETSQIYHDLLFKAPSSDLAFQNVTTNKISESAGNKPFNKSPNMDA